MDILANVMLGFSVAIEPANLLLCFSGVLLGTLVGVLPGLGPVAAISLLLPLTFKISAAGAIIMLAGIYYGAMYGGSTTSILMNIPGEAASIITCIDGYKMARQGRAGPALGIAAFGSFIAGTFGVLGLTFLAPWLGRAALRFGPPEYLALMLLGLTLVAYLSRGSVLKAFMMAAAGLWVGTVGSDPITGHQRFSYGSVTLMDGIGIVPVAMGMFGIAEVLENIEKEVTGEIYQARIKGLFPNLKDWAESFGAIVRGTILGFFVGLLPGPSAAIAAFSSYAMEKRLSKNPQSFGQGAIAGVAGPESANNAATAGAFIPLLSLGIPANLVMALLMGALMVHGVQPGPLFISEHPDLFFAVITSMYIGNIVLLFLNLPLIGLWVRVLKTPYFLLSPVVLLLCLTGAYTLNNNLAEVAVMIAFGVIGFFLRKFAFDGTPFLVALVLGPTLENNLRQSLIIARGDLSIFVSRPLSMVLILAAGFLLLDSAFSWIRNRKYRPVIDEA
ncbi:MAG: tripartite tricarboxylate transporter permease [Deltaproteobacteria bacterium]|nr:tripartite tricarboxylate transporter permease [Deltaproteobacteria bacterium]